jgi:hypothetical protein
MMALFLSHAQSTQHTSRQMHRIIEQTTVSCGMVKTPNPSSHQRNGRPCTVSPSPPPNAKGSHTGNEARTPTASRRVRMHIVLLASEGLSPTEIARVLLCSYAPPPLCGSGGPLRPAEASRLSRAPKARPQTVAPRVGQRAHRAFGGRGVARFSWVVALSLELQTPRLELLKERAVVVSPETIRRTLHRLGFRWREGRDPSRHRKTPRSEGSKSAPDSRTSCKWWKEWAHSFRTRRGSRPTSRWASAGWAKANTSPFLLQGQTARRGSVGRSTSIRAPCTG